VIAVGISRDLYVVVCYLTLSLTELCCSLFVTTKDRSRKVTTMSRFEQTARFS